MRREHSQVKALLGLMVGLVLLLAAVGCGDTPGNDAAGKGVRIVSLSPTATEMVYAIDAGSQVVAVDDQSDYPAHAPKTKLSGYDPNLEAILGYSPDVVLLSEDSDDVVKGLENAGVRVLVLPAAARLDDTYRQIEQVGTATGKVEQARTLVASMRTTIDELIAAAPKRAQPIRYYHELDSMHYSVTDDTFIGGIYQKFGLTSIATGATAYPQLSVEAILAADPAVIFLADSQCCGVTVDSVKARAGWSELTAVRTGQVHLLDDDIASRWGPRVVDLVREIARISGTLPTP